LKKKSLFALVAMVLLVAGVAFAAIAQRGFMAAINVNNPNAWSAYTQSADVDGEYRFLYSGNNSNKIGRIFGINSQDATPGNGWLLISTDNILGAATAQHVYISGDNDPALSEDVDLFVINTRYAEDDGGTQTVTPSFWFVNQLPVDVDIRLMDDAGKNVLPAPLTVAANNGSCDVTQTLAVQRNRWDAPKRYYLQFYPKQAGVVSSWKQIPIYVDSVHTSETAFEVAMFNNFNADPASNGNNTVGWFDVNRDFGQTTMVDRFFERGDRRTFDLGFVPDFALNVLARTGDLQTPGGLPAQLNFFVRNEGSITLQANDLGNGDARYDNRFYYGYGAGVGTSTREPYDAFLSSQAVALGNVVSRDYLFPGFVGLRQIGVATGTWTPHVGLNQAEPTFNWTPARLNLELAFGTLDAVPDVQIRKMAFPNTTPTAANFGDAATMYGGKRLMIGDTTIGWNAAGTVTPVSVKGVATMAFNAKLTNKYKADSPEVYAYPMQVTLRIVDQKVHDAFGGDKWRQLEEAWTNIGGANGLKKFLDVLGPQKVVGSKLYPLAQLAFDKVKDTTGADPRNDLAKYIQVRKIGPDYYVTFLMMVVDMANPVKDGASIVCHRNLFVVYDGATDNALVDPMYIGEPTEVSPTTAPVTVTPPTSAPVSPTSGGSSSGGGCSACGFAPLALLLLAPLALLRKRG